MFDARSAHDRDIEVMVLTAMACGCAVASASEMSKANATMRFVMNRLSQFATECEGIVHGEGERAGGRMW